MRVDVFGVVIFYPFFLFSAGILQLILDSRYHSKVYQTKLANQVISKEFEIVQEYSARLGLVKTREVN